MRIMFTVSFIDLWTYLCTKLFETKKTLYFKMFLVILPPSNPLAHGKKEKQECESIPAFSFKWCCRFGPMRCKMSMIKILMAGMVK